MSKNIKGISIEIGGDTKGLDKALDGVNKKSRSLQGELKEVQGALKFNPNSVELLAQKQKLLTDAISATSEKLNTLKDAQAQVQKQYERGEINAEQYRAFQREIQKTESQIQSYRDQISSMNQEQRNVAKATEALGEVFAANGKSVNDFSKVLGTNLVNAIKNGTATSSQLERAMGLINDELKRTGTTAKTTAQELKAVEDALKLDPGNATLLAQNFDVLQQAIQETENDLESLKDKQADVERRFARGEIDAQSYREFQREIETTQARLNNFRSQADNVRARINITVDDSDIDRAESKIKKLGDVAKTAGKEIGDGLKAGAAVGTGALTGLVVGTSELATDLARLKTNADIAGRDLDVVTDAFKRVAQVSGETDSAVETVSNLLASGFSDNQLSAVIDEINGAAIRFSDTLKTEGIADGIQETFATGAAIGQFGELLERSGVNLDVFNEGLAKAKDNGTAADYILQQMADLGLSKVTERYKELNPEVAASAEANANLQVALSELGTALSPIITFLAEIITKIVEWAKENEGLSKFIGIAVVALGGLLAVFAVIAPIITTLTALAGALGIGIGALVTPIGIAIAAIGGLIAVVVLITKAWDPLTDFFKFLWEGIVKLFKGGLKFFTDDVPKIFTKTVDGIVGAFKKLPNLLGSIFNKLKDIVKAPINYIISMLNKFIASVNKIKIPDFVPVVGGKGINIPQIPMLAKGTNYFKGGKAIVGEQGPELVEMPTGAKVHNANKTADMLGNNQPQEITIPITLEIDGAVLARKTVRHTDREMFNRAANKRRGIGLT